MIKCVDLIKETVKIKSITEARRLNRRHKFQIQVLSQAASPGDCKSGDRQGNTNSQ